MASLPYSGREPARPLSISPLRITDTAFAIAPPSLPHGARPVIDDAFGGCVGFIHEGAKNVWHIYDITGQCVGIEEVALEAPILDPYDLILIGPAIVKFVRAGFSAIPRLTSGSAAASATSKIANRILPLLRSRMQRLSAKPLQFTETTARHMANPGRFVPIHILQLAIKHGRRTPDPQKVAGVFRYEVRMSRFVKRGPTYARETKTLEVVVRESDRTILHFMYY